MKNNCGFGGGERTLLLLTVTCTEVRFILHIVIIFHQLSFLIICILYNVLLTLSTVQNTMTSQQHLRKTTSILIKPTNTEPGFESRNTNLLIQACQVTAQQANTVPSTLSTMSLSLALFSCCRQLRTAETSNLLLGDRARPEQACGVVCAAGGWGAARLAPASALARPCLAALNLSPIKSPSLAGCN